MKILHRRIFVALVVSGLPAHSAIITWDNDAKLPGGADDPSYHAGDNWDSDNVPTAGDDVKILAPAPGGLIRLTATSATVNTIQCTVPFQLSDTLIVTSSGNFENSLTSGFFGRIRADGTVTFTGANALSGIALEGSSGFVNNGTVTFGSRGVSSSTPFQNNGVATLLGTSPENLGIFENIGTLNLGAGGNIGSTTTLTNKGTLRKDNPADTAKITAHLTQESGKIEVGSGATLEITGATQHYNGGTIDSDGSLLLSHTTGSPISRIFDGLTSITGDGTVLQNRDFELRQSLTVNLPNAPGYQTGSLTFGKLDPAPIPAILSNAGHMSIKGSPGYESVDPALTNLFQNLSSGTVSQEATSQPRFRIAVLNAGTWTSYGMNLSTFNNTGTLLFEGSSQRVNPSDVSTGGTFFNSGIVTFGQSAVCDYVFAAKYEQRSLNTTTLKNGVITLEGGSDKLSGEFKVESNSRLLIKHGVYECEDIAFPRGSGSVVFGGSQLTPEFSTREDQGGSYLQNHLGVNELSQIDESQGFFMRSGLIDFLTVRGQILNAGNFEWSGGTIKADNFLNLQRLSIPSGPQRSFDGGLENQVVLLNDGSTRPSEIVQSGSLALTIPAPTDNQEDGGGIIYNLSLHRLHPGAFLSGGGTCAYRNSGTLICENSANAVVSASFDNSYGTVIVKAGSILHLTNAKNVVDISSEVTLSKGKWIVEDGGQLLFGEDIDSISGADWQGSDLPKIQSVIGVATRLYRTDSMTHTQPLEVSEGGEFKVGDSATVNIPSVNLASGGRLTGTGTLNPTAGSLNVSSGVVAPGDSPGTLNISGDTNFSTDSIYEWEASSDVDSDLVNLTSGTASLAGAIRPKFLDNYLPAIGTSFTILTATAITGTFDFIDLSSMPPGLSFTPIYSSASVTLQVTSNSLPSYESWKDTRFSAAARADVLISGPNADPDSDGRSNLQEYAHGTNPNSFDSAAIVEILAATDTTLDLKFNWTTGAGASFTTMTSVNLLQFGLSNHSVVGETPLAPGIKEVVVRTTRPSSNQAFACVKVTLNDPSAAASTE